MKTITLFLAIIISVSVIHAQPVRDVLSGVVYGSGDNSKESLNGAVVKWINTRKGVLTGSEGKFEISRTGISDNRIIVSYEEKNILR